MDRIESLPAEEMSTQPNPTEDSEHQEASDSVLKMYQVAGREHSSVRAFERYRRDQALWTEQLQAFLLAKDAVRTSIQFAPEIERTGLIREALRDPQLSVQQLAAELICTAPLDKEAELIRSALMHSVPEVQQIVAGQIGDVPRDQRAELIRSALTHASFEVQRVAAWKIQDAPEDERAELIRSALTHSSYDVQRIAAQQIGYAPRDEQGELYQLLVSNISTALGSSSAEAQQAAVVRMRFVPFHQRADLIRSALTHSSFEVQRIAAGQIGFAPDAELGELYQLLVNNIAAALESASPEVQRIGAGQIIYAPGRQQAALIRSALESASPEVQRIGAALIVYVPMAEQNRLRQLVDALVRAALESASPEVQRIGARMLKDVSSDQREELAELAMDHVGADLVQPPLYDREQTTNFLRRPFAKSGSETTLLGGQLTDKVILRHLKPEVFVTWQELYQDHELWRANGFDYVPIEPIVSFHLNDRGLVDVASGVLDLNLAQWRSMSSRFRSELAITQAKILAVLDAQKISHGHPHNRNFCLRFWRKDDGQPDFERPPRLYLIDFDQASSADGTGA